MLRFKYYLIILLLFHFPSVIYVGAQTFTAGEQLTLSISSYCLIGTNNAPVNLNLTSTVPGAPITSVSNSDVFVKVSSIVPGGTHRELTARISSGTLPTGTTLTLKSAPSTSTNSDGVLGVPNSTPIVLNGIDQELVDMIATCYTGTGYNDGYQLTYTWKRDETVSYDQIKSTVDPVNITVVLTVTAHDSN